MERAGIFYEMSELVGEGPLGMAIFATGPEEARSLLAGDPAAVAGVIEGEVRPWYA